MIATAYRGATGQILGYVTGANVTPESTAAALWGDLDGPGVEVLVGGTQPDHTREYVADGALAPRPEMPVTQVGNTLTVPAGTEFVLTLVGSFDVLEQGVAEAGELTFDLPPGEYNVRLTQFPYLDAQVQL